MSKFKSQNEEVIRYHLLFIPMNAATIGVCHGDSWIVNKPPKNTKLSNETISFYETNIGTDNELSKT